MSGPRRRPLLVAQRDVEDGAGDVCALARLLDVVDQHPCDLHVGEREQCDGQSRRG